ncbi:MAG: DUF1572 family protein [Bacillus sp. (in: firmicutes)]
MIGEEYLRVVHQQFRNMKRTAEAAMGQVSDSELFWRENEESNSIAILVKHMSGNMVSRWTDFFFSDGEKEDRHRDEEFHHHFTGRQEMMRCWEQGWTVFMNELNGIAVSDLLQTVSIRGEDHTVIEAIERQMHHYSYHVGQIVYVAKQLVGESWHSLTIPRLKV